MLKHDALIYDVKTLKIKASLKDEMHESLKVIQDVLDSTDRMIAMLRARRERETTCAEIYENGGVEEKIL